MTPALESTIGVSTYDPNLEIIGSKGPSPSNQALVVFLTQDGGQVLMAKDYDLRKLGTGDYRPTHGALKAAFGFGLPKEHKFTSSFDALINGPANIALYKMFDLIEKNKLSAPSLSYAEGGEGWGPAVTIPVFVNMESAEAKAIVAKLNLIAGEAYLNKKPDDIMTGRFRDFTLVPLKALLSTGNNVPAVYDQTQLQTVEHEGRLEKLWDESQMRANLLPHVAAAIQAKK